MADIRIYIEYRNSRRVVLPVNPEKFEVRGPGNNTTERLVSTGDINILKLPGLRKVSFESFIPVSNSGAYYILQDAPLYTPQFYIDFFTAIRNQKEAINLVVTGLDVTITMGIESFDYRWEGSDEDMWFKLELKEWRAYRATTIQIAQPTSPAPAKTTPPRENTPKGIAVGVTVRVNGRLYRDSYGNGPGQTEKNAIRKISHINQKGSHPYHVVTLEGAWRGWVTAGSVEVI